MADEPGGAPPLLRRLDLDLPAGSPGSAGAVRDGGLVLCTAAQFAIGAAGPAACPANAAVGTARIDAPSVGSPLKGRIFLGAPQDSGGLPSLYVEVSEKRVDGPRRHARQARRRDRG